MIWVQESYINQTAGYRFGDTEVYESGFDQAGPLFKAMQCEYGRCVSKVYIDGKDGKPRQIGWVFQKTVEYEDARADWPKDRREYVREVWVTLHSKPPVMTTRYNYLYPSSKRPAFSAS